MLRDNRFRLVTLGRLTLLGDAGEEDASLAKRRRKLVLLSVLAMARRPLARDTLLSMFWGEEDEARARHSLSNALSSLRRVLGQQAITTRDADVALAPETPLDVDALELADVVEGREFGRAIELYGGPFLEGIHVDDSPDYEQWVSRERRRLETLFLTACAQHCAMLARARRWEDCHTVAARWLDTEPLSHDAAIFLLNAIKAPGTRSALADALEEYERLKVRLARDFDVVPERGVRQLAESMREQLVSVTHEHPITAPPLPPVPATQAASVPATQATSPPPASPASPATSASTALATQPPESVALAPPASADRAAAATLPPMPAARPRWLWGRLATASAIGALAFAVIMHFTRSAGGRTATGKPVVAVMSMSVQGNDSALVWLADGLPQMISGKLAHIMQIDVVNPAQVRNVVERSGNTMHRPISDAVARDLSKRVGATMVARGAISRSGSDLVLELTVNDVRSGNLLRTDVLTRSSALTLADEAAARILNEANVNMGGPQLSQLETSSVDAYQHYMRALEHVQAGRYTEYSRELDAALALDSGFIPVLRARIGVAVGAYDDSLVARLRRTLERYNTRASPFDQAEQLVTDAFMSAQHERSEALARDLVRRYPRDPRAYMTLQGILGSHGKFDEAAEAAAQMLGLDSLAIEAGKGPCSACFGLGNVVGFAWNRGDLRGAVELARRWVRAQSDAASPWAHLAWAYSYLQLPDSALPLMQRAVSLSGGDGWSTEELARMLLISRRYATADSAIAVMESSPLLYVRENAADLRSLLERERGRFRASTKVMDRLAAFSAGQAGFAELTRSDNLRYLGEYDAAAQHYEVMTHPWHERPLPLPVPPTSARAYCWHHALAGDAISFTGDTVKLRSIADTLQLGCSSSPYARDWRLHHHLRGLIAMKGGRYEEAEREFKQAIYSPVEGWSRTVVELANAQVAAGRPRDAIATLRTGYATRLNAMGRYAPISELDYLMALAFGKAGEPDSARKYSTFVRTAWRDADPERRQLLARLP